MNTDNRAGSGATGAQAPAKPDQDQSTPSVEKTVAQAKDAAGSALGQAKDQALGAAEDKKEGIADRIDDVAKAVHRSGEQFEGKQDWIAHAIEQGAAELSALADTLRDNDIMSLAGKVQSLAKRQPALFISASLAAGFAVARLGKVVVADATGDDLPTMPRISHADA